MVEMLSSLASLFSKATVQASDPTISMPWELYRDVPSKMASAAVDGYNPYREFNSWVNDVFFSYTVRHLLQMLSCFSKRRLNLPRCYFWV